MPTLPITNTEAAARSKAIQYLGSFWSTSFPEPAQVRALANLPRQTPLIGDFKSIFYNLAGQHSNGRQKTFFSVPFKRNQVIQSGMQYFDDPNAAAYFGSDAADSTYSFNFYRLPYNALYMGQVTPTLIQAYGRTLAIGIDFFLENDFIFFRDNPAALFPWGFYTVILGTDTGYKAIMSDFLGINVPDYQDILIQYVKKYQTPAWFKLAAAGAAGMGILRHAGQLLDIQKSIYATIYIFEKETIQVSYAHELLVIGNTYPKHYVIGDGLQIVYGTGDGSSWWRQINWCSGISLDPLIPEFKGLQLLDRSTYAFAANSDIGSVNGSRLHARVDLGCPNWERESRYWEKVAQLETTYGFYLNAVIRLSEPGETEETFAELEAAYKLANAFNEEQGWPLEKPDYESLPDKILVNALDVFFEAVLSAVSMIIRIDPTRIGNPIQLYAFLATEMTPGATPIILALPPPLAGETIDCAAWADGPAAFYPATYLCVTETVEASSIITDSVRFYPEVSVLNIN